MSKKAADNNRRFGNIVAGRISSDFGGHNSVGLLFVNFIFCIFIGMRYWPTIFK
jgi:hypothetical protein